ncbi:MAG: hypothetical protein ACE5R6_21685, partial [Candidatus Heimdallarchaeota archaeon]
MPPPPGRGPLQRIESHRVMKNHLSLPHGNLTEMKRIVNFDHASVGSLPPEAKTTIEEFLRDWQ